jgi:ATP-binding cassette, subfamily B, bacterial
MMAVERNSNIKVLSDIELEEKLAKQQLNRSMFWRLVPLLKPVRAYILTAVVVEVFLVGFVFLRPYFIQQAIDHGLLYQGEVNSAQREVIGLDWYIISWTLIGLAGMWAARFVLAGLSQYFSGTAAIRILNQLRVNLFSHVQQLSVAYFDRTKSGRIISRIDRDIDALEPLLIQGPPEIFSTLLRFVMAAAVLLWVSPTLFYHLAAVIPLLILSSLLFRRLSGHHFAKVAENRARFTAHLVETVAGVRIIKQTVQEESNLKRYRELVDAFIDSLVKSNVASGWFTHFTGVLTILGLMLLLVAGGQEVVLGHLTLGQFAASLFYVYMFLGPLQELGDLVERYTNGVASAQRIFLLLDTQPEIVDHKDVQQLSTIQGQVEFKDVFFSYLPDQSKPVIRNLNLTVPAGKVLAIVGATGHGKSTLIQLLTRFYDVQQGQVLIDHVDIRHLTQRNLRRHVGVVLQDNVLFSGTIIDNLRLARSEATLEEFELAATELGIHDLINRLPHGYHTEVGALGSHLSHGQRQLICLLRAYLANPTILILDEATSAVDIQTERRIQHALRRLCEGRTAIIIAHRLATIRDADLIAVIHHGELAELGPHTQLIQGDGRYTALYHAYEAGEQF